MNCIYEAENTIRGKIQMRIAVCDDDEQSFVLKNRDGIARIVFARLEYAEVINKKVSFYLTDGAVREVTAALADFEEKLLARPEFLKVHRSYIVNLNCVQAVGGGNIVTAGGRSVPVARKRWSQVQDACMHFLLHRKELQAEMPEDAGARSEGPWRILLVDDEEAERERWADVLRSHGCEVRLAADGEEALEKAAQGPCDCVLLDVMLHGEDTFLLCGQLGSLAQAPVIFLSCLTGTEEQMKGFAAGGVDYITKDTPAGLFWAKVQTRIRLALSGAVRLRYGPLVLELSGRKVFLDEKELDLTPAEFDLLQRLSSQAGQICTPEALFESVCGGRPWDGGQTVQMHMSRLRRKLEQAGNRHHFIETVWGKGYRFVTPDG